MLNIDALLRHKKEGNRQRQLKKEGDINLKLMPNTIKKHSFDLCFVMLYLVILSYKKSAYEPSGPSGRRLSPVSVA